jgi:hypothetical protein
MAFNWESGMALSKRRHDIQQTDIYQTDIQHNNTYTTLRITDRNLCCVAIKTIMLSVVKFGVALKLNVIMLSVIIENVAAPSK